MKYMITTGAALFVLSFQAPLVAAQEASTEPETTPSTDTHRGLPSSPHQETVSREIRSETFKNLDQDGDGQVSKEEAQKEAGLTENWSRYDGNSDGNHTHAKGDLPFAAKTPRDLQFLARLRPQPVINSASQHRDPQPRRQRPQRVEQAHRIRPPRDGQ